MALTVSGHKCQHYSDSVQSRQIPGIYFATSDSRWVWAGAMGMAEYNSPYVFQTEFYLEVDLSQYWFEIRGKWGADNFGYFTIDQAPLPPGSGSGAISLPPGQVGTNFQGSPPVGPMGGTPHAFSISQAHLPSLSHLRLGIGWHTFEVWVYNEGDGSVDYDAVDDTTGAPYNPAGFNVSAFGIDIHPAIHPRPVGPSLGPT